MPVFAEQIDKDRAKLSQRFDGGRTILHLEALSIWSSGMRMPSATEVGPR